MNLLLTIALLMAYTVNPKIHHWESALNVAVASHLSANGISDPKKQRDTGELVTPRAEIKSGFQGYGPNQPPHRWIHPDKTLWPDTRKGTLAIRAVTRRGEKGQDHDGTVGTIRSLLQSCSALSGKMELHKVEKIIEMDSTPTTAPDEHHDATLLTFEVTMRILFGIGPGPVEGPNPAVFITTS